MWRIFYYPDTGVIKYQINIEAVATSETLPYIDVSEKITVKDKIIDLETKELVIAPIVQLPPVDFGEGNTFNEPTVISRN